MSVYSTLMDVAMTPLIIAGIILWRTFVTFVAFLYDLFPNVGKTLSRWLKTIHGDVDRGHVVITIPYSHFCEKVRWAYEVANEPLEEISCATLFHNLALYHSGGKGQGTVPTLVTAEKTVLTESSDCLRYLADIVGRRDGNNWLIPCQEIEEFDRKLSTGSSSYGRNVATVTYYHLLNDSIGKQCLLNLLQKNVPAWQAACMPPIWASSQRMLKNYFKLNDESTLDKNLKGIDEIWGEVEKKLQDGRKYIFNTAEISAADIGFAALSYPLVLPPEMDRWFLPFDKNVLPLKYWEEVQRRRNTVTGKFILRLYNENRHQAVKV